MKKSLLIIGTALAINVNAQTVIINPTNPWTVPSNGVTTVTVECWGGGGGGGGTPGNPGSGTGGGNGGGGGAYSKQVFTVVAGQTYNTTLGAGGAGGAAGNTQGSDGGTTTFTGAGGTCSAAGGSATGAGGNSGTGFVYAGGAGGLGGYNGSYDFGGGGGGAAGNASAGVAGTGYPSSSGTGGAGGTGSPNVAPYIGGTGGTSAATATGSAPGGGGSGGQSGSPAVAGNAGAVGQVVISYKTCSPPPTFSVNSAVVCAGTHVTLTASGGTSYVWSSNAGSATTNTVLVNPTVPTTYTVTGTNANTCTNTATGTVTQPPIPLAPAICEVSTDSLTNYAYNIIYWDKTLYNNVDSFVVYRYDPVSNGYLHIGSVSKNSFSAFTDTCFSIAGPNGGNPVYGAWQYKLAIKDTCGRMSALSAYHSTIFVSETGSNFSWTQYIDSGYSSMPTGYSFLRDNYNTGNFVVLANLGHTASSTTDPNYASYPNANWRIDALGFNCNPTLRLNGNNSTDAAKIKAHSNINNNRLTSGIKSINQTGFNTYSYNNAIITNGTIPQGTQLKVVNALGQVVLTTALQNNIETTLPSGIYTVQVIDNTGSILEIKKCALINNN